MVGSWQRHQSGRLGGGRAEPASEVPWANLGGVRGGRVAWAAGRGHGAAVRRVRLVSADGEIADDTPELGVALLPALGRFPQPWTVELYDAAGGLLRRHPFVGGRPA